MVKKRQKQTEEDLNPEKETGSSPPTEPTKGRYAGMRDDISEEDLEDHAVAKVVAKNLLGDNKELRREITDLKNFKDRYYEKKEETAVLTTQLKSLKESTGIRQLLLVIGGVVIGFLFLPDLALYRISLVFSGFICFFMALWSGNLPFAKK